MAVASPQTPDARLMCLTSACVGTDQAVEHLADLVTIVIQLCPRLHL